MARGAAPALNSAALREARLTAGLSQAALARAAGADRRQVIRYENGEERPEIKRLAALARACEVTIVDLVDENALPPGLAGLRLGAGMTMAAAAAALADRVDPTTGIATNRASLAGAEKGRLPLSWRSSSAGSQVRGAMAAAYEVDIDQVRVAWQATVSHKEVDQDGSGAGSINATSNETATQTPPPHPYPSLAESAVRVWGTDRPASQAWRIRARIREADGTEVEAVATGIEGSPPVVGWWTSRQGLSRTVHGQVIQVLEWTSPWRSMPEAAPDLPGARPASPAGTPQIPFDDHAQEHEKPSTRDEDVRLELLTPAQADAFAVGAARMYRVHQDGRLIGFVWRDSGEQLWICATATTEGSVGLIAPLSPRYRRTRQSVLDHLLHHWRTPGDRSAWMGPSPTSCDQEQVDTDQVPGVAVLVSGNPDADRPHLPIKVDGDTIGHLADLHTWNGGTGWAFYPQLTVQEQRAMTRIELGGRPPAATTTVIDIADAVRQLLPQVLEQPVRIDSLHGHHAGLVGLHPQHMEGWELHHGRVSGREDVYARGRCWGWLQGATGSGRTAHTTTGPVPGGPWATREEAVTALWAHLTAPLPPPNLGERARAKRRIRAPRDTRPLCPYTDAELVRVRLVRDRPEDQHSPYRAESPVDHRVLGYVWRKDARRWSYAAATGRTPEYSPALPTAPTRAAALEALLAQPGPLWADPDSAIVH